MISTDRLVVALTGVYFLFAGWQLRNLRDLGSIGLDGVWPWWFVAAGVACVLFAVRPSADLLAVSGMLAVTACVGRSLAIVLLISRLHAGGAPPRGPLAAGTLAALAALIVVLWLRVFRPLVGRP